jgi:uncharacterized membrane protein YjjB (DUF3815 family)
MTWQRSGTRTGISLAKIAKIAKAGIGIYCQSPKSQLETLFFLAILAILARAILFALKEKADSPLNAAFRGR